MVIDNVTIGDGRRVAVVLAAAVAVMAVAACDSGPASSPSTGTTQPPAPTAAMSPSVASPVDVAKQQALTAYLRMWDDFVAAAATSDWQSPKLGQYATGLALSTLSRGLYADKYNGIVSKGAPTHDARVSSVDPSSNPAKVIVSDCSDSTNALKYRADNGQRADDGPGGRRLINATVQKQSDGSWKVSDFGVQGVGTC